MYQLKYVSVPFKNQKKKKSPSYLILSLIYFSDLTNFVISQGINVTERNCKHKVNNTFCLQLWFGQFILFPTLKNSKISSNTAPND